MPWNQENIVVVRKKEKIKNYMDKEKKNKR